MLKETTIRVPEKMAPFINTDDPREELERNAMLLYPYIHNNTMSHGKAAEILGVSKTLLVELYGEIGIPYLSDVNVLDEDFATISRLRAGKCL